MIYVSFLTIKNVLLRIHEDFCMNCDWYCQEMDPTIKSRVCPGSNISKALAINRD